MKTTTGVPLDPVLFRLAIKELFPHVWKEETRIMLSIDHHRREDSKVSEFFTVVGLQLKRPLLDE